MPSKPPKKTLASSSSKRAALPLLNSYTRQFHKDWTRLSHSGRHDMVRAKEAMLLVIAHERPLPPEWLDHELAGEWDDHRELHVKGDLLLIYRLDEDAGEVIFVRLGTHHDLFDS